MRGTRSGGEGTRYGWQERALQYLPTACCQDSTFNSLWEASMMRMQRKMSDR